MKKNKNKQKNTHAGMFWGWGGGVLVCGVKVEECRAYNCLQLLREERREVRRIKSQEQLQSPFPRAQSCEAQRGSKENVNGAIDESYPPSLTTIRIREMGRHSQTTGRGNQAIPTSETDLRRTFEDKIQNTKDSTENLQTGSVPRVTQLNLHWQMLRCT